MKKSELIIPFLKLMISQPGVVFKSLYHTTMNYQVAEIAKKRYGFANGLQELDILQLFPDFKNTVDPFSHLYGTSFPIDIAILKTLAARFKDCEYLEIGSWRGESLANVAPLCKECTSVSLSDEEMHQVGLSEKYTRVQRFFSKKVNNIKNIGANSQSFNFKSLGKKFDLIFVDGDHSFAGVKNDTEKVFQLLRDENSIIVWHDYVSQYELINWEVLAGILAGAPDEKRENIYHITNSLCAIYIQGNFKTHPLDFPSVPVNNFKVTISAEKI